MRKFDWISFAIVISLMIIGLMMIYAAGYQPDSEIPFFSTQAGRQSIFAIAQTSGVVAEPCTVVWVSHHCTAMPCSSSPRMLRSLMLYLLHRELWNRLVGG